MDVRMPDGTVIKNVPDGITKEELSARLGSMQGSSSEPASFDIPETQGASRSDFYKNSLLRGVENLLSLGPSALDALTGASGRRDAISSLENAGLIKPGPRVPTATEGLQSAYRGITGMNPEMEAPDTLTRYGGKALEFAVTGGPFSARTVAGAAHRLPGAVAEIMSAGLGGVGHELGGDIGVNLGGETGRGIGQLVGSVGGSLAGMATPVTFSKIWSMTAPNISEAGRRASVNALAGKKLGGAMAANPVTGANIAAADDVVSALQQKGAGEFRPTLGQMSGAEGVQSIEGEIARKTPQDLGRYAQRATENRQVVEKAKDIDFPAGGDFRRGADVITRATVKKLDERLDSLTAQQERLASQVSGGAQQATGERLRELRDAAQQTARASRDAKIQDVYATADRLGVSESMDDAVSLVRKLGGDDTNTFQQMPPVFRRVLDEYAQKQPTGRYIPPDLMAEAGMNARPASFQEVHSLWRETNSQLATATRVGDTNATYYLEQLKGVLRGKLAKYEQEGQGELSDKFREFNKWFSTKYAPAFYEGVGGRMSATTRFGEAMKPEQVVGKFFTPSGVDDFQLIYGADRNAQNALRDGVLGMFAEKAIKDGRIDQRAAESFMRANTETLNKLPDIRATLGNAAATNEALLERASRLRTAQSEVSKSTVAKIANTEDPASLVQKALTDRRSMMGLIASAKDAPSRRSVLRAIADNIPIAAEKAGLDPLDFVTKNESVLRSALNRLGPQHYDNLKILANAETIMGRAAVPTHAVTPRMTTSVEELTGSSPRTIWAQTANTAAGRQSHTSAVLHLLSRFGIKLAEERADDVLREVIYNPELARDLVRASSQPFSKGASNRISGHLTNAGIRVMSVNEE